jgi:peptide chain release factor subunit 3
MPIAAQQSQGIKERGEQVSLIINSYCVTNFLKVPKDVCTWYDGPSLLEYLDGMKTLERKVNAPFMMPIAAKYRDMGTMVGSRVTIPNSAYSD